MYVEDYWIIEVFSPEWAYVMKRLIRNLFGGQPEWAAFMVVQQGFPVFFIRKDECPAGALAHATGIDAKAIASRGRIRLIPQEDPDPDLPLPTVFYHGEA